MNRLFAEKYNQFYDIFRLVAKPHTAQPYNLEFNKTNFRTRGLWQLCLKEPIYLAQWPVKKDLSVTRVDVSILVNATVRYEQGEIQYTRSSVYVTYFMRDTHKKKATVLENLRFDFHPETGDTNHPLLHAHIFADGKPNSYPPQLTKNFTINWDSLGKKLNAFRLPIPNMTFPSVLCCLVACHLSTDKLKTLLDKTREHRELFPSLAISTDQLELLSRNSFAGSQWFERP